VEEGGGKPATLRSGLWLGVLVLCACSVGGKTETFEQRYQNGQLASRGQVRENLFGVRYATGFWEYWYPDGTKAAAGSRERGPIRRHFGSPEDFLHELEHELERGPGDCEWTVWHPNGKPAFRLAFRDGRLVEGVDWYPSGWKKRECAPTPPGRDYPDCEEWAEEEHEAP